MGARRRRAERTLEAAGLRLTGPRRAVIETVAALECALTAEEIHRRARRRHETLGLVTVYRTLDLLVDTGLARRLDLSGPARYEPVHPGRHHHHLVCLSCGGITPLQRCLIAPVEGAALGRFRVTDHRVDLFGYCGRCEVPA